MSLEVTVHDTATGKSEHHIVDDSGDYLLLTDGPCHVANLVVHRNGTHQITVRNVATSKSSGGAR